MVKEAFELFRKVRPDWANAVWGGFYPEVPTARTSIFRERPIGSLVLAATKPDDVIMASNYDRIFANVMDVCETLELLTSRRFKVYVLDLDINISTDLGQAVFKIMAAIKELEVKEIRRRNRESKAFRKANGLPIGLPPLGWKNVAVRDGKTSAIRKFYVPDQDYRATMNAVAEMYTNLAIGMRKLVNKLNDRGLYDPRNGRPWRFNRLQEALSARKKGYPLYNGSHTAAPIPPDSEPINS